MEFDLREARRKRDEALRRVQEGPGKDEWIKAAKWTVLEVALTHKEFTTDEVWATGLPACPGTNRALGPVMMAAAKAKVIERTPYTRDSKKVVSHARPVRVWESLVWRP